MGAHHIECRWHRTTPEQCAYRRTHEYCPHPEHACNCQGLIVDDPANKLTEIKEALMEYHKVVAAAEHASGECGYCGMIECPYSDPFHLHHDGCPSCTAHEDH